MHDSMSREASPIVSLPRAVIGALTNQRKEFPQGSFDLLHSIQNGGSMLRAVG